MSFEPVVTFAINRSDGVTTVSESLKRDTYDNFKIEKEIEVIYNFIDLRRFSKKAKDHFRKAIAPFGEKLIVHTSNFRKVKRIEDVVYAFDRIIKKVPSKLLLIGDGPERPGIEKLCRDLGNCDHVRFLGKQDAIEEILSVCDLFMMPSESESFGLAALEAMACQVPVISTNTGGMPELNIHGETGYLSNVGDFEDMANHAIHLLTDPEKLSRFRKNALEQAKRFDIHVIMPQYEQFYMRIIESMLVK
jgi:N-acetyl-alpha-D-glucosaminyl L-malate synthase BshA